jgi:hypothetical protein
VSCQKVINIPMLLIHLNNFSSPSQIQQPDDEIVDEEFDVARPYIDDIVMSEQGSEDREDPPSGNEEDVPEFPGFSNDEDFSMLDAEIDSIMPDFGMPADIDEDADIVAPDLELESLATHASLKVTHIGARRRSRGQHANQCLQCNERGSLRRQVDEIAGTAGISMSKRCKTDKGPTTPVTPRPRLVKRGNAFHGGLRKNWKAQSNRCEY